VVVRPAPAGEDGGGHRRRGWNRWARQLDPDPREHASEGTGRFFFLAGGEGGGIQTVGCRMDGSDSARGMGP
jgi:hypothetical protein